ncbi:MAG: hypothetical protein KJ970_13180 [Candidatus Eisenbacteria bacterium]|uniref:Uncharacterized protein n=1 Tax=Eiseniibacteriota bacterium TaxID=2212470 RepID=A0A948W464_UNCEI|nr:hypothetical protein [Candidatus Eisenbacteria bacterium]MBU1949958.1 hypothetical protein [Candidatus Eisenbacteria bacterium]MBU2691867.1 hypothetical protein [Candidatus Eisenbacteria bacterium]
MGYGKHEGAVAFVRASSAADKPATGYKFFVCDDADIELNPQTYEAINNITPDTPRIEHGGFELPWHINGIEPNVNTLGYAMACALGGDTWDTDHHDIEAANSSQYINALVDKVQDLGTSTPTQRAFGAKISEWSIEFQRNAFFKMGLSGMACNTELGAALSPSMTYGANNAPLSWACLTTALGGYFKYGVDGADPATSDPEVLGFKIAGTREQTPSGYGLESEQPTRMNEAGRGITFEITKEFCGTHAKAQWEAFKAKQVISVTWKAVTGTSSAIMTKVFGQVVGKFGEAIGTGAETIMGTLQCKAFRYESASPIVGFTIIDGTVGAYWI